MEESRLYTRCLEQESARRVRVGVQTESSSQPHRISGEPMALVVVATSAAAVRASQFSSSSSRLLPALAHRSRAYRSLMTTPAGTVGNGRARLQVRAARLESTGVSVGFRAPQFELPEPMTGKIWTLDDFEGSPALLVMFICNHCPFVKHLKKDIAKLTSFYMEKGLASVAISSIQL
uniref:Uncharacterized protein n=1 Tax=Avena sativa TaxID=4498 RepID=A0ACD5ZMF4_AVESA